MEDPTTTRYPGFDLRTRHGRAYVAYGVWLRVALIGAVAAVAGIVQLFSGDAAPLPVLALAAGGALIAYLGWRRAIAVLDAADAPPAAPAPARSRIGARAAASR